MPLVKPEWSTKAFEQGPGGWTASLTWTVSDVANEREAINAVPVREGSTHPLSSLLFARSIGIQEALGPSYFRVVAQYDQRKTTGGLDPLSVEPTYSWHLGGQTANYDRDVDGNPLVNSAREPSKSDLLRFTSILELSVTRNEPGYDLAFFLGYANRINDTEWMIEGVRVPPFTAFCRGISPTVRYASGRTHRTVGYSFLIIPPLTPEELAGRSSPFDYQFNDVGFQAFYSDNGTPKPDVITIRGSKKQPTAAVQLNGQGKIAKTEHYTVNGQESVSTTSPRGALVEKRGETYYLRYKKYLTADFNRLGL